VRKDAIPLNATAAQAVSASSRLEDYPVDVVAGDLFRHAPPGVAERWHAMAGGLQAMAEETGAPVHELVARQIQDLGLSFRIAGDEEERNWPLTPMPLIIGADEWAQVERGLIQRARLLEKVAADVYGPQQLVADGHLPAAVVAGSRFFARNMIGLTPRGNHYLNVYAVDLARGPLGQWRVLSDRLRLANGIGYALENRLALSRSTGSLLSDINVRRLANFLTELREGIALDCQRENPRIALLTPGRFNQSYPEQAHLSRYLGFPLVEGRDLTVSDDKLYVRTIAGPKRIDAVWRWIDTNALDPLSFDSRSTIGVPDLFDAWARGGLEIANWPGVEALEAPAFAAFLPRLCRVLLGEEPLLPNIATWWCGQAREVETVRARIDELFIAPAFGQRVEVLGGATRPGANITGDKRDALFEAMQRRPMDYCGQEIIRLSTTPVLAGDTFEPRAFTVRAFVARGSDGEWTVMPGGFARLSASGRITTTMMGEGDLSADVCIVDEQPLAQFRATALGEAPAIRRGSVFLASQAADNLFWFGRYCERAEMTVRIIRSMLGSSIEVDAAAGRNPFVRQQLLDLLYFWGALSAQGKNLRISEASHAVLIEAQLPGGVTTLVNNLRSVGLSLRDRFAPDFWRLASRPVPLIDSKRPNALLQVAREMVERFSALSGLVSEDMVRGPAWHFLDLGRRLERALAICRMARQLGQGEEEGDSLSVLLDLCDSQITYRSRYLTRPLRAPVFDLLLLDADNPRSLVFQLEAIVRHIAALPVLGDEQIPEAPLRGARAALAPLQSLTIDMIGDNLLIEIENRLLSLSEAISARYFLQYEKSEPTIRDSLLV